MSRADEVKRLVDLADYIRGSGIELVRHGRSDLKGLCPFHDDHEPSLVVTPAKGLFHCMSCGVGGSVIDFVAKSRGITVAAALKVLAADLPASAPDKDSAKIPASSRRNSPPAAGLPLERANELLEKTVGFYEKAFAANHAGRRYLENRGITDAGLYAKHRLGYADGRLLEALPKEGKPLDELLELGVLLRTDSGRLVERFYGAVVFPVCDSENVITTIYGRVCENNSGGRRHLYLPGRPTGVFNAAATSTYPEIVIVESAIDVLSLEMAGVRNALSIQGTNGLGERELAMLRSADLKSAVLLLDGDTAGRAAAGKLGERLEDKGIHTRIIELPEGLDPNAFLLKNGAESLRSLFSASATPGAAAALASGVPCAIGVKPGADTAADAELVRGLRHYSVSGIEKKPRSLRASVRSVKSGIVHVDTIDFYSSRQRRELARELCRVFEELPETVEGDIAALLELCENHDPRRVASSPNGGTPAVKPVMNHREIREAREFGSSAKLIDEIMEHFEICGLVGEEGNKLLCYLAMTSRLMPDPLSVLILSSSGAGKTALQDAALAFCPPEDMVKLTSLSAKALFYKEKTSLKHKVLAIEEGAGAEEASYAIRNLISSDGLTSEVAMRDPVSGKLTTMANTVEGPVAVFCTTTDPEVDPETKSRFLVTGIDESREQTRRILEFQKRRHSVDGLRVNLRRERILALHRNFQRLLEPLAVVNPHINKLAYSDDRLQGRRAQPQYLNIINAVAFLRQLSREKKEFSLENPDGTKGSGRYIEVDASDIETGHALATKILGRTLDELSIPARDLLELTETMIDNRITKQNPPESDSPHPPERSRRELVFTRRELREFTGWTASRIHTHLRELVNMEYILQESGRSNSLQTYRLLYNGQGNDGKPFIPGVIT